MGREGLRWSSLAHLHTVDVTFRDDLLHSCTHIHKTIQCWSSSTVYLRIYCRHLAIAIAKDATAWNANSWWQLELAFWSVDSMVSIHLWSSDRWTQTQPSMTILTCIVGWEVLHLWPDQPTWTIGMQKACILNLLALAVALEKSFKLNNTRKPLYSEPCFTMLSHATRATLSWPWCIRKLHLLTSVWSPTKTLTTSGIITTCSVFAKAHGEDDGLYEFSWQLCRAQTHTFATTKSLTKSTTICVWKCNNNVFLQWLHIWKKIHKMDQAKRSASAPALPFWRPRIHPCHRSKSLSKASWAGALLQHRAASFPYVSMSLQRISYGFPVLKLWRLRSLICCDECRPAPTRGQKKCLDPEQLQTCKKYTVWKCMKMYERLSNQTSTASRQPVLHTNCFCSYG